jgi:hypothetical protein
MITLSEITPWSLYCRTKNTGAEFELLFQQISGQALGKIITTVRPFNSVKNLCIIEDDWLPK